MIEAVMSQIRGTNIGTTARGPKGRQWKVTFDQKDLNSFTSISSDHIYQLLLLKCVFLQPAGYMKRDLLI